MLTDRFYVIFMNKIIVYKFKNLKKLLVVETGNNPNGFDLITFIMCIGLCEIVKSEPDVVCYPASDIGFVNVLYNTDDEEVKT